MVESTIIGVAVFVSGATVLGVLIWLFKTILDQRRWSRLSKIQAEVHSKLMDRFSSNDELLTYVQTPSGRRFLESGPSPLQEEQPRTMGAPFARILWSVQIGVVLLVGGLGLLYVSTRTFEEAQEFFFIIGVRGHGARRRVHGVGRRVLRALAQAGPVRETDRTIMRNLTLSDIEQLRAEARESDVALEMDEEAFRAFYDRTARVLRAYLSRVTGDGTLADDLLQETYYRFLRARSDYESEAHRRNSLFRIASNLVRDDYRRRRGAPTVVTAADEGRSPIRRTLRGGSAERISGARWRDCGPAIASCSGWLTPRAHRTGRLRISSG